MKLDIEVLDIFIEFFMGSPYLNYKFIHDSSLKFVHKFADL